MNLITPPEGVRAFIKSFGTKRMFIKTAQSMGFAAYHGALNQWEVRDAMPEFLYQAMKVIVERTVKEDIIPSKSFIDVYFKGEPLGSLYLHRDITLKIRKQK